LNGKEIDDRINPNLAGYADSGALRQSGDSSDAQKSAPPIDISQFLAARLDQGMKRLYVVFMWISILALGACAPFAPAAPAPEVESPAPAADLVAIKRYLLDQVAALQTHTAGLKSAAGQYYALAEAAGFDYAALWANNGPKVGAILIDAKSAWLAASPLYEQMEGIVAGVPSLADYDVILDAGASGAEDPENAAPFDLTLPDGRVLPRPGNLFGVTESTLWGTYAEYIVAGIQPDLDGNGAMDFGEVLPDANVLKAGADALDSYTNELAAAARAWEPTETDAFTALVVMIPTMSEYFDSWKNSRFVAGEATTQRDFVAISRLLDIQNILASLQVVYSGVKPLITGVEAGQAIQIEQGLGDLKAFVAGVYQQEQEGKRFTAEEADLLGAEAQNRATAIAGQIVQVAAQLGIPIQ
jgi:hypothetical protein